MSLPHHIGGDEFKGTHPSWPLVFMCCCLLTLFLSITMLCETHNIIRNIPILNLNDRILCKILLVPWNIVMNVNNVILLQPNYLTYLLALTFFHSNVPKRHSQSLTIPFKNVGIVRPLQTLLVGFMKH